jgi:xanthine dehydrogenase accessory factor
MRKNLSELIILIKGGGEMASGVAYRLFSSHFRVCMTEIPKPQSVRREVSFCEAIYDDVKVVEGVKARRVESKEEILKAWERNEIPILVDPEANIRREINPDVLVDAILAKRNLGTNINDAPLVIGLGPGFKTGVDAHVVIETNRGHNIGRIILSGEAEPNTGIPGVIGGFSHERVLRAPSDGIYKTLKNIGDTVKKGEEIAYVNNIPVNAKIDGIIRGLLRDGLYVKNGLKLGDVDPRGIKEYCYTISDKARAIAGGVLEGIMMFFNKRD